eukprot:TRINITY_DN7695_c0_g1_i1.p1 TRINITY_DN7695_c0_g1~~TRINITY_DN7695_c0_g1_i1.p1  ORF type:complete len:442 (-),score=84.62 TRINITY_DN7695_c0_g1_i1:71-1396(-)
MEDDEGSSTTIDMRSVNGDVELTLDDINIREAPSEEELRDRKKKMVMAVVFILVAALILFVGGFFAMGLHNDSVQWTGDDSIDSPYYTPDRANGEDFCNLLQQLPPSRWNATNGPSEVKSLVKIAFVGDVGPNAIATWELVKNEDPYALFLQGDFDYAQDIYIWKKELSVLSASFPFIEVVGNHDVEGSVTSVLAYHQHATDRILNVSDAIDNACEGYPGFLTACNIKGVVVLQMAIGTACEGQFAYEKWLDDTLTRYDSHPFKVCAWHKERTLLQVGDKRDEVPLSVFEICRKHGAIVMLGHEHSYERTHTLKDFNTMEVGDIRYGKNYPPATASDSVKANYLNNTVELITVSGGDDGQTVVVLNGLGGKDVRKENMRLGVNPWWSTIYTSNQNATYAVVFCDFGSTGPWNSKFDSNSAYCYLKNINGKIVDQFVITSAP